MTTKVFLSWSGDLSKKLAEALRSWLPSALQAVRPYFTPEDIEKGSKWSAEISKELETSEVGIICLTRENLEKPWILFEAGALSKNIKQSHVCTLLFDLEATEITGPLTSFQATKFLKEDFKKLVQTINACAGEMSLNSTVLDDVFDVWWPKLEKDVTNILATHSDVKVKSKRSERDILEELLELTRMNSSRGDSIYKPISKRSIQDLVEGVTKLQYHFMSSDISPIMHPPILMLMDTVRNICLETGHTKLSESLDNTENSLMRKRWSLRNFEPKIETSELTKE